MSEGWITALVGCPEHKWTCVEIDLRAVRTEVPIEIHRRAYRIEGSIGKRVEKSIDVAARQCICMASGAETAEIRVVPVAVKRIERSVIRRAATAGRRTHVAAPTAGDIVWNRELRCRRTCCRGQLAQNSEQLICCHAANQVSFSAKF